MSRFPRVAAIVLTASLLVPAGGVAAQDASPAPVVLDGPEPQLSRLAWRRIWQSFSRTVELGGGGVARIA